MKLFNFFKKSTAESEPESEFTGYNLAGYLVAEIRLEAYIFKSALIGLEKMIGRSRCQDLWMAYNKLMAKINDSYSIATVGAYGTGNTMSVSLHKIARDFSESYSERFGDKTASKLAILLAADLPNIISSAGDYFTLLDLLARAGADNNKQATISITKTAYPTANNGIINLEIKCHDLFSSIEPKLFEARLSEITAGNTLLAARDLGFEFYLGIGLVTKLGGRLTYNSVKNSITEYIFTIPVKQSSPYQVALDIPNQLYLLTNANATVEAFNKMAKFYDINFFPIKNLNQAPLGAKIIYDALELDLNEIVDLANIGLNQNTIFLLSSTMNEAKFRLAEMGYKYTTGFPFISSDYLEDGLKAFEPANHNTQVDASKNSRQILVVDDAPSSRLILKDSLESAGYIVTEAIDGTEIIALHEAGKSYSAIFCDLNMAQMSGPAAISWLRNFENKNVLKRTPVVLITAYASSDTSIEDNYPDFDRILIKPISSRIAPKLVAELLNQELKVNTNFNSPIIIGANNGVAASETKIIDVADLVERCGGRKETAIKVINSFITSSDEQIKILLSDNLKTELVDFSRCVHAIKGMLRDVGACNAARVLQEIELKLSKKQINCSQDDVKLIQEIVGKTKQAAQEALINLDH